MELGSAEEQLNKCQNRISTEKKRGGEKHAFLFLKHKTSFFGEEKT
jgi:hypothetical protein